MSSIAAKTASACSGREDPREARISTLKRGYGWDRARLDDLEGARIWAGHGVLAHNLVKIATLAA
jgi:IS5 family transposase